LHVNGRLERHRARVRVRDEFCRGAIDDAVNDSFAVGVAAADRAIARDGRLGCLYTRARVRRASPGDSFEIAITRAINFSEHPRVQK
jgi:hypothetical protein